MKVTKRMRVECALAGTVADRLPFSFWTHFPGTDLDPEAIADESVRLVRELDLDFLKTMPNGLYCVEDWGIKGDYSEIRNGGAAKVVDYAVNDPSDWAGIRRVDIRRGAYGRELTHLKRVVDALGPEVPVLVTVFSPVTVAKKLAGDGYRQHLTSHPQLVKAALSEIAATMSEFAAEAIKLGCAGAFIATQESTTQALSEAEYREFGVPFDHDALEGTRGGWFNVLHMHGDDIMFDLLVDYPVQALNWHVGETGPTLESYVARGGAKPVVGGMRRWALTRGEYGGAVADIDSAVAATGGRNLLLTPACVIRHPVDCALLVRVGNYIKAVAVGGDRI